MKPKFEQVAAPRPRLVLRVGFAGKRDLSGYHPAGIQARMGEVLDAVARQLVEISPNTPCSVGREIPDLAKHFDPQQLPLLRLVTGLCEGADTLAFQTMETLPVPHMGKGAGGENSCFVDPNQGEDAKACLEKENAAVIGFDFESYLASRDPAAQAELARQAKEHSYILVADGKLKKDPDEPEDADRDKTRRGRGYRSQSDLLLRQSDILMVVLEPSEKGAAGGSLETLQNALAFQLPVILINPKTEVITVIEPGDYLPDELEKKADADWKRQIQDIVLRLTADEERGENLKENPLARHGLSVLDEYFSDASTPPKTPEGKRKSSFAEKAWDWFYGKFKGPRAKGSALPESAKHYRSWRSRATELNYHYAGLYRGTFLLNSLLAVFAVFLATSSIVVLGNGETAIAEEYRRLLNLEQDDSAESTDGHGVHAAAWFYPLLWVLAACKLAIVFLIYWNTKQAHKFNWNDRMVDYRYLAERMRGLFFLPEVGSWQPPAAAPPQYASRVVRQSAVDWLFDAITRSVSPELWAKEVPFQNGHVRLVSLNPSAALQTVQAGWLEEQWKYHENSSEEMGKLSHFLEKGGERLNKVVIGVVVIDLIVLGLEVFAWLPYSWHHPVRYVGPWIILLAAVFPAVVAALNVVRFQSECQRLAERSAVLARILGGREDKDGIIKGGRVKQARELLAELQADAANGGHAGRVLHFTEGCADIFVQEAAEWSVLYAKEMVEQ